MATCCRNDWQLDVFAQQEFTPRNLEEVSTETTLAHLLGLGISTGTDMIEMLLPVLLVHPRVDVMAPIIVHVPHFFASGSLL